MAGKPRMGVWRDAVRDSDLDRTAKLVALTLSTYANGKGLAWPGRQTLARGASISDRAVDAAVRRIEAAGFVEVERTKGGSTNTNRYVLKLPATANAVRHSEWARANVTTPTANGEALNGEGRSHESIESGKSGALHAAHATNGDAVRALIEDFCGDCGERKPLVDDIYCADCAAERGAP